MSRFLWFTVYVYIQQRHRQWRANKGLMPLPQKSSGWWRKEGRHWLRSVLYVSFSVLTLLVGWQERVG